MLRVYEKGQLSSGFVGVRVSVSVANKPRHAYFSYNQYDPEMALILAKEKDRHFLKMQLNSQRKLLQSKRSNTGVKNLSFSIDTKIKENGKQYSYPVIAFQCRIKGRTAHKKWFLENLTISNELWGEICLLIKNTRTLKQAYFLKLLELKPDANAYFKSLLVDGKVRC